MTAVATVAETYVLPGEIHCSETPRLFRTVLGSCVSVCLWDAATGMGGLNHFVLPASPLGGPRGEGEGGRFGDVAIPALVRMLTGRGCVGLAAKVFGGAAVLHSRPAPTVGDGNVRIALSLLHALRIPVVAQRTGGTHGIALRFLSATGEVLVRRTADVPQPARADVATWPRNA